jgi:hypothetical protein
MTRDGQSYDPLADPSSTQRRWWSDQAMQLGRVRDHRLGYQRARRTHAIAAFNFLHHIFADDFQQAFFTFGHSAWLDIEDAERSNRKVVAAERNACLKAKAALS